VGALNADRKSRCDARALTAAAAHVQAIICRAVIFPTALSLRECH